MIRINLLGQKPPKKPSHAVPAGTTVTLVLLIGSLALAFGILWAFWHDSVTKIETTQNEVNDLKRRLNDLQAVKANADLLKEKKQMLDRQYIVLDQLSQNRSGGQELFESLAGTVVHLLLFLEQVHIGLDSLQVVEPSLQVVHFVLRRIDLRHRVVPKDP